MTSIPQDVRVTVAPIKYFLAYYGKDSWKDLILRWNGTGTQWVVTLEGQEEPVYSGPDRQVAFTGQPNTSYTLTLTTTVDGVQYQRTILTYTTLLPAPTDVVLQQVSDSAAAISWAAQDGVASYDVADVSDSFKVVVTVPKPPAVLTGLSPSTRCSFAVRGHLGQDVSRWSSPVTFFTRPPDKVAPGDYVFDPAAAYVYAAGRPGSADPGWQPAQGDWYHGDGLEWGDSRGPLTTYFFFGASNPFNALYSGVPTRCQVYVDRFSTGGDPGPVLSRLGLHGYPTKPDGEPLPLAATVDAGVFDRGDAQWVDVPLDWANQLIIGAFALGVAWGGVPERYMVSRRVDPGVSPRTGSVRITIG